MSIEEKSKEYAKGKALDAMTAAIEQAYADGYNDGLKHFENEKIERMKDGVDYKDLDLTSKTLWSSHCVEDKEGETQLLPYLEASKLSLPTKEDFEELFRECRVEYYQAVTGPRLKIIGKSGEVILLEYRSIPAFNSHNNVIFWLNDDSDNDEKLAASVGSEKGEFFPKYNQVFMGIKLPVMLVKKRNVTR